jgi:hypothetical protein
MRLPVRHRSDIEAWIIDRSIGDTDTTRATTRASNSFLALPTEIRQQILVETVSDQEILDSIELRAIQLNLDHRHHNLWQAKWCAKRCTKLVRNIRTPRSARSSAWWVVDANLFAEDWRWVAQQWEKRQIELGRKLVGAWEKVFGER